VGVATLRALARCGVHGVGLKWPNDLVVAADTPHGTSLRKLGGTLIEMRAESAGPTHVVAGLGMNLALDPSLRQQIGVLGHVPAELAQLLHPPPERNRLVAALLDEQIAAMQRFGEHGLPAFLEEFAAADVLAGQPVQLQGAQTAVESGVVRGIAPDGALLVEQRGQIHRIIAGEVSVRSMAT
jgi:BirA family biotin operon repressor/biotin-[acetyl-CoA-carboxylase] ligase